MRRPLIALIAGGAILQWAVVLERATAAVWAWYKFVGYGGGGHIVVGFRAQVIFFLGSAVVAIVGNVLDRLESKEDGSRAWRIVARCGWLSITICCLFWVAFLLSPLVTFHRR